MFSLAIASQQVGLKKMIKLNSLTNNYYCNDYMIDDTDLFSLQLAIATGYTERALSELLLAKLIGTSPIAT